MYSRSAEFLWEAFYFPLFDFAIQAVTLKRNCRGCSPGYSQNESLSAFHSPSGYKAKLESCLF